ncbi:hypothetical protein [Pseudoponticoccus marisrubri]|uniref:Uncharacterized protein n=1 Tax=Pseudoponticoccus marisrubri TaxID=1685382 RepID=A0A0W7WMS8_9RHOB|nr:hypothetical protein [Pseudoponticoccus marisrubri]KUF11883.1 hypothetical protein AVJ23_04685 [Pseudoponticoccus marisrubri]
MPVFRTTIAFGLSAALALAPLPAAATSLTAAECVQAQDSALNYYKQAKANTKLFPTEADAKRGAQTYFARRIMAELGQTKTATHADYTEAVEHCRRKTAGDISKLIGLLGAVALKGVRGPKTN